MTGLDAEELFHLALHATQQDDPHKAIECLKQCLDIDPGNGRALYLLGALYAQLGMYERAGETMQRALEINPREYTAVFQLGLLHLTNGDVESARGVWQALDELDREHFLYLFKSGLLALAADDFAACAVLLERGMQNNKVNEALNNDMYAIKVQVEQTMDDSVPVAEQAEESALNHLVLSGYQQARKQ